MIERLEKIWQEVNSIRKISDQPFEYIPFNLEGIVKDMVLIGIDKEGRKMVLLKDKRVDNPLPKPGCTRLEISRDLVTSENGAQPYIKIICLDDSLENVFSFLISRLIRLLSDGSTPNKATIDAVSEFRRLLSRAGGPLPSDEEILGLTGELIFISQIIKKDQSLWKGWNGPSGSSRDFTWDKTDVEIKASFQAGEPKITINNLNQLEPISGRSLFLFHSIFVENPKGNITVPDLVEEIYSKIEDKEEFEETVFKAGYSKEHKELWLEYKFSLSECSSYSIEDEFPRINEASFKNGLIPESISKIRYEIDLNKVSNFKIENEEVFKMISKS